MLSIFRSKSVRKTGYMTRSQGRRYWECVGVSPLPPAPLQIKKKKKKKTPRNDNNKTSHVAFTSTSHSIDPIAYRDRSRISHTQSVSSRLFSSHRGTESTRCHNNSNTADDNCRVLFTYFVFAYKHLFSSPQMSTTIPPGIHRFSSDHRS